MKLSDLVRKDKLGVKRELELQKKKKGKFKKSHDPNAEGGGEIDIDQSVQADPELDPDMLQHF